jgi:integrase
MKIRKRQGKRSVVYLLDYRVNGYRKIESLGRITKREAELIMAQRQKEIAEGRFPIIKDYKKVLFFDICDEFLEWSRTHKRSYIRDEGLVKNLKSYFGNIPLYQITRRKAEEYQAWRIIQRKIDGKPISPATVNREIAMLKRIINKATEWGKASKNPISKIKMFPEERKLRFLSQQELTRLVECSPEALKPIILVAVFTGMRRGEILNLKWSNIRWDLGLIYVEHTKTNKIREIPMAKVIREILWQLKKKSKSEHVFVDREGNPLKTPRHWFDKAVKDAGINDCTFHTLRHTFASDLVKANVNLKVVQELLGHRDLSVTLRYAHLSPGAKEQAIQMLNGELGAVTKRLQIANKQKPEKAIPLELLENKGRFEKAGVAQLVEQRFRKP